jgi:hypothetical protein
LKKQKEKPGDKDCAVDVYQGVRQLGSYHAREEVALSEAGDDNTEDQDRHPQKKNVIRAQLVVLRRNGGYG